MIMKNIQNIYYLKNDKRKQVSMKKRDLVLDFTSLLDVIMIILFVVISSMGQASFNAKEEAQKQLEENAKVEQNLEIAQQALKNLQSKYDKMDINNAELQKASRGINERK